MFKRTPAMAWLEDRLIYIDNPMSDGKIWHRVTPYDPFDGGPNNDGVYVGILFGIKEDTSPHDTEEFPIWTAAADTEYEEW